MRIKLSRHSVCSWTWALTFASDSSESESGYCLVLEKSHPTFEAFKHVLACHTPRLLRILVEGTRWYERAEERNTNEILKLAVDEDTVGLLCPDLWKVCTDLMDEEEE